MLAAIVSLLKALTAYFDYKSKTVEFDFLNSIDKKIEKTKNEINKTNRAGNLLSLDDLLREHDRLKAKRELLSTKIFGSVEGDGDKS